MRGCTLHISWIIPDITAIRDITHFMIYIDGVNVYNQTNSNDEAFLSFSYFVRSCGPHNASVSIVNCCDRAGPLSPTVIIVSPDPVVCEDIVCEENAIIGDNNFLFNNYYYYDGFLFRFSLNVFGSTVYSFVCACYGRYDCFSWSQYVSYLL